MSLANLARQLNSRARIQRAGLPSLILVTDSLRLPDPLAAAARLPRGAAVLLRHYGPSGPNSERAALARRLAALCRRRGLVLLIAEDARLAMAVGAAGLHLSEGSIRRGARPARLWRNWNKRGLVTAAAHSPQALARARRYGADAALLSPVFATASHPGARGLGVLRFTAWVRQARLPVLALGGIAAASAKRLKNGPAAGLAAIGGLSG